MKTEPFFGFVHMIWEGRFKAIRSSLIQAKESITIVSPYITLDALESLLADLDDVPVRILTSWRKDDFIAGIATTALAKACDERGWIIHVFHDGHERKLHSKMYIADDASVWLGSTNLTGSGLGTTFYPNHEIMTCVDATPELISHVSALFAMSQRVDSNLINHFVELEANIPEQSPIEIAWQAPAADDLFESLWAIMPTKPDAADFDPDTPLDELLHLRGCRWGEFRAVLRSNQIDRDVADDVIASFYEWALASHPGELDVQTGGRHQHTQCLVWRMNP